MKTNKIILIVLAVFFLLSSFSMQAIAAASWFTCTIDQVGPYGLNEGVSGSYIYLTSTADPPAWDGSRRCIISPNRGKEYLATALAALANGKQVMVYINPANVTPTINGIYIQK